MVDEVVQEGTASDGNGIVYFVETIADPAAPTLAEIVAGTLITYGLTPDGFQHNTTVATITTGRYTLAQALEKDGIVTDTLELTYVYNRETPTEVETALGVKGTEGFVVSILGYPNGHELAEGDVLNAVIPVRTSIPRDVPPAQNTELAKIVKLNVTGTVHREVAVAGGV